MGKVLNPINKPEEEIIVGAETGADGTSVIVGDTAGAVVPGAPAVPTVTPTFTVGALQDKNTFLGDNGYTVDRAAYDQKFGFQNTYEGWLESQGLDPDADFQNARNELEYERKTWDAGYGERAEQLYQMGLTNSGVSDIYGANAFSSYLSAMNDLNVARINMDKQLKKEYNDYVTSFNTGFDEHVAKGNAAYREYESGYKSTLGNYVAQAYKTVLSSYNGSNEDELRSTLVAHGYDDVIINETLARLGTLDKTALGNARVLEGYEAVKNAYTGPASAGAVTQMLQKLNRTDSEIASILQMLEAGYAASPEGQAAAVNDVYNKYAGGYSFIGTDGTMYKSSGYDPSHKAAIIADMKTNNISDEQINTVIQKLETEFEQKVLNGVEVFSDVFAYTDDTSKKAIKTQIGNLLMNDYGYTRPEALAVVNRLENAYELKKSAEQNAAAGEKGANINDAVATYSAMYNGTEDSELLIRNMLARDNTFNADEINTIIDDIKAGYQAGKAEEEENKVPEEKLINDAAVLFAYDEDGNYTYTGSESQEAYIRQILGTSAYSDYAPYADKIIEKLDSDFATQKNAMVKTAIADIDNADITALSLSGISSLIENYKITLGTDSEDYKAIEKKAISKIGSAFQKAFHNVQDFKNAYSLVGVDKATWDITSDGEKLGALVEATSLYMNAGLMTKETANMFVDLWYINEADGIKNSNNAGYALDYIDTLKEELDGYYELGIVSGESYSKKINELSKTKEKLNNVKAEEDWWDLVDFLGTAAQNAVTGP